MIAKIVFFIKKYKIFVFLLLILAILIALKFSIKTPEQLRKPKEETSPLEKEEELIPPEKEPFVSLSPSSKELSESELGEEEVRESLEFYPLINYLPIDNERYHLTYTNPFELTVNLKQGNKGEIKKEIINWISSKDIDPSTHQIIFK